VLTIDYPNRRLSLQRTSLPEPDGREVLRTVHVGPFIGIPVHQPRVAVQPLPADIPSRVTTGIEVLRDFSVAIDQRSMAVRLTRADSGAIAPVE
jgi:hypothetical protein